MTPMGQPFTAEEVIRAIGIKLAEERAQRMALEARLNELAEWLREPGPQGERGEPGEDGSDGAPGLVGAPGPPGTPAELSIVPDDIAEQVSKAICVLKESSAPAPAAIVLNINSAAVKKNKTITTRRDKAGNLVADVVERD